MTDPEIHGPPHRDTIFEPVDWQAEQAAWREQERKLEAERQHQLASHPSTCLCTHCELTRANADA